MLNALYDGLEIILFVLIGFPIFYILLLTVIALFVRQRTSFNTPILRRFSLVVPAHNEESVITKTLQNLLSLDYPRDRFDVVVIADNCTDKTAQIAAGMGATVFERINHNERGKGYALRWCFDKILAGGSPPDCIVVIDADGMASTNFLSVMNFYVDRGAQALQSNYLVEPQPGAWSAEATRLGFALYNYVRPLGRRALGGQVGARGNGMCFTVDLLRRVPWNAYTQCEDLEYGLNLLLSGIPVEFAPECVVLTAMPASSRNAESQRLRWEAGRFPIVKSYAVKLLTASILRRSFRIFDAFIDLVTPSLVNLLAFTLLMGILSAVIRLAGIAGPIPTMYWFGLATAGILHVVLGVMAMGKEQSLFRTMLYIPRYVVWKFLLYFRLVGKGHTKEWVRTTRE